MGDQMAEPERCIKAYLFFLSVAKAVSLPWPTRVLTWGGALSEGKLVEDSIVCPYHSSRFALEDGRVLDGPAVHPQPCLEVRARNGQIEVRKALIPNP